MGYVTGQNRYQIVLMPKMLEEYVDENNPCRVVDAFVNCLDLDEMEFKYSKTKETGRPPFDPKDMLKLYIYGYQNKIRSSRRLQKETLRNVEVMWLLSGLTPDDKTISNFRMDNRTALKKVFSAFSKFCMELSLFGKKAVAIDGTKIKANNSRKHRHTKESAEKQHNNYEKQISEYLNELERNDSSEEGDPCLNRDAVEDALEKLKVKSSKIKEILAQIEENDGNPICTVDEDAALMKFSGGKGFDVCHNVQTATDEKNGLVADFNVTGHCNDMLELSDMVKGVQDAMGVKEIDIYADSGYSNGEEIKYSEELEATCYIPKTKPSHQTNDEEYRREKFKYDAENDQYICPAGNAMPYVRTRKRDGFKMYANRAACKDCPVKEKCTKSKTLREIGRSPYQENVDRADRNAKDHPDLYRRRQELCEHPYGIVKRIWGFDQFLCRGNEKVTGEVALTFLAFNMRRAISILGVKKLVDGIKKWAISLKLSSVFYIRYLFVFV